MLYVCKAVLYVCKVWAYQRGTPKNALGLQNYELHPDGWFRRLDLREGCAAFCAREWWHQVRYFKDCLHVLTTSDNPELSANIRNGQGSPFRLRSLFVHQVRLTLPSKKMPSKEGMIVILGEKPIPEHHQLLVKKKKVPSSASNQGYPG